MSEFVLSGCRTTPLSGYLSALGVHRAVHRLLDPAVGGWWDSGRYVLRCSLPNVDELAEALHAGFCPESIVSPWNSGSGFAGNGKSVSAERALQWVRDSTDTRLVALRCAVDGADRVIIRARQLGIADPWDKKRKPDVLRLCRNELPDAAVAWLDAAVALGQDDTPSYSRLLGTGGNLGRQDLSATYLQQVRSVMEHRDSLAWLKSALDGRSRVPLPRDTPGQYDPGGVGASDEPNPVGNPWTLLFVIEGALLFATAVVRKYGVAYAKAALPFQVSASTAGFVSSAANERPLAELWAPEWSAAMGVLEVEHLLGEGRADWSSRAARSGLDMARATASLGVDRGVVAFQRHVFVERLGQNPLAVPAGRIEVGARGGVDLLAPLDRWRDSLHAIDLPARTAASLRVLEQAIFDHATTGTASALADVFAALGRCRATAARSRTVGGTVGSPQLPAGAELLARLRPALDNDRDLRIALALATSRDRSGGAGTWLSTPALAAGFASGLADISRRRGFPLATDETVTGRVPAVRGARIAFEAGLRLRAGDTLALVEGEIDDARAAALVLGLSCVDWRGTGSAALPGTSAADPALDLMLQFSAVEPLDYTGIDGQRRSLFVRPGHNWAAQLIGGHIDNVLSDAARRLRIAGLRHVVSVSATPYDGTRLAAALLITAPSSDRSAALGRIAVLGSKRRLPNLEESA